MIVELLIIGAAAYVCNYLYSYDERNFKNNFQEIMNKIGIKNKADETFKIKRIENTNYGYTVFLNNVKGLSVEHLVSKKNILEDNLNSIINIEKDRFTDYIKMQIVNKDITDFKFEPVKCKENQIYLGKDFKGQNYFIDLNKDAHLLIGGATGSGKSFLLAAILTNLIYNSQNNISMYLFQICKSEISAFQECKCIEDSCYTLEQCMDSIINIIREMDYRSDLFKEHGIRNINQWNKHKKSKYMKRIIVVIEEISFFLDTSIWKYVMKIAKAGRSVGIHLISCVQRSTATNIPPDLKSQMSRVTFRQKSNIDSLNIINTTDAVKLKLRECIIDGNNDYTTIKTPWIDEDYNILNRYVKEIRIPGNIVKNKGRYNKEEKQIYTLQEEIIDIKEEEIIDIKEEEIIDIKESETKMLGTHTLKSIEAPKKRSKKIKGVISLEEFQNANRKR